MGQKLPPQPAQANAQANAAPRILETKPGPPPVLTKRGADILVRVEKLLDDAAKTANKTTLNEPSKAGKPESSSALAFPENYIAAAGPDGATTTPAPRKN
jgi:penicillin-binding protein 1A